MPKVCEEKANKCEMVEEVGVPLAELPSATQLETLSENERLNELILLFWPLVL